MFFKKKQTVALTTDVKKLLPVGSVILLKEGEKRLMIIGIMQNEAHKDKMYDYLGVYYPEGHIGGDLQFLFNHEDIDQIYFRGYEDDERTKFIQQLEERVKQ